MPISCKSEFQAKHFGFTEASPQDFYESQWGTNRLLFLIYRLFMLLYHAGWIIADHIIYHQPDYWIYLTSWTEVTASLFYLSAFIVVAHGFATRSSPQKELRWFHNLTWILSSVSTSASLIVIIMYYGFLSSFLPPEYIKDPLSIHSHGIIYLLHLIDLFVRRIPIRLLHFIYPMTYGVTYVIFTLILHWSGYKSAVYAIFDWGNSPGTAVGVSIGVSLVALPAAHAVHFGFYQLRAYIAESCCKVESESPEESPDEGGGKINKAFEE